MSVQLRPTDRVLVVKRCAENAVPPVPGSSTSRCCYGCGHRVIVAPSSERALQAGFIDVVLCWYCVPDDHGPVGVLPGAAAEFREWGDRG